MPNINSLVDSVLKKYSNTEQKSFNTKLSNNLEFRLLFNIDLNKPFKQAKKEFIKNYLSDLFVLNLGNISRVAEVADLNRRHIHRLIHELDIEVNNYKEKMLKPTNYLKENVQNIVQETVEEMQSAITVDTRDTIYQRLDDISKLIANNMDNPVSYDEALRLFEKEYIIDALKNHGFDIKETALAIDISERTLYRKMKELNIDITNLQTND